MRGWALLLLLGGSGGDEIDPARYVGPDRAKPAAIASEAPKPYFGISGGSSAPGGGVVLSGVLEDAPAWSAGLRGGDRVVSFGGEGVRDYGMLLDLIRARRPRETVRVLVEREGAERAFDVTLGARRDDREGVWQKPGFRLAAIPVAFEDVAPHPSSTPAEFERMLFSRDAYRGEAAPGQEAFGSLADYYRENSYGRLAVTGRCFDWVRLSRPRAYFEERRIGDREGVRNLFQEAVRLVRARDGAACLEEYDGLVFIYAGKQSYRRPWLLWPHRASLRVGTRTLPYYLNAEGGKYRGGIGVHVHEFGHMLGLPDQYGKRHATGVGKWCAMAVGHMGGGESRNARPFHLCAWCKERLGWVKPVAISPAEAQWLKLEAIERDAAQVFKVPLRADGREYYLLENRQRRGFDAELEGTGLLVWHVAPGRPGPAVDLVEAHGAAVENASLVEPEEIPFPSFYNRHFTPDTAPAARAGLHVTDIVERDEVVYFKVGTVRSVTTLLLPARADY